MNIQVLKPFSSTGIIFQDFGHFIVAAPGILAMLPWQSSEGKCPPVVEGCPIHFSEVALVLDALAQNPFDFKGTEFCDRILARLYAIDSCAWCYGEIPQLKAWVFVHRDSGLRIAYASELLLKKKLCHE